MARKGFFPPHLEQFVSNIEEVELILRIHRAQGGRGPGRKRDVEVLNKSAIVLLVACWEAFVEDLSGLALDFMIKESPDHTVFPKAVLERVAQKNAGIAAWSLAGDGWRKAMRDNYKEILAKTAGSLNTPRAGQVDDLFAKTIGLQAISKCWYWKGRTNKKAIDALDQLITLRGSIAHRVKHSKSVQKREVVAAAHLVNFLAAKSSNNVRQHVLDATGKAPWLIFTFRGIG